MMNNHLNSYRLNNKWLYSFNYIIIIISFIVFVFSLPLSLIYPYLRKITLLELLYYVLLLFKYKDEQTKHYRIACFFFHLDFKRCH